MNDSASAPVGRLRWAARAVIGAASSSLLSITVLHVVRPELGPADHMLSEYALGPHGGLMSFTFAAFAVSTVTAFLALRGTVSGRVARAGLVFLLLAGIGLALGALFPTDPPDTLPDAMSVAGRLHGVGFMLGVPSELLAVLLLSFGLRRAPRFDGALLLALASGVWLSIVAMVPLIVAGHGFGIPNRTFMMLYGAWLIVAARPLASTRAIGIADTGPLEA